MILCCGEALIDMIPAETAGGETGFVPHVGGAVFNTAIALGRLGVETGMLTGVSQDLFGEQLAQALVANHVDTTHVVRADRPTTLAFVELRGGHATYTFYDENSAGRMLQLSDLPELHRDVSALYFGGISLACEPAAETYAGLLAGACEGRAVMIDPNIRPSFIRDIDRFRARLESMLALADIVKVSDDDLNWIIPDDAPLEEKVAKLQKTGPSIVVLTRGEAGAHGFLAGRQHVSVPVQKVKVVDTVGAGDTFNAGVLASLSQRDLLTKSALAEMDAERFADALNFGSRVAAVTVSRSGANPPWASELD